MDVKGKALLQLFNKSKLWSWTKTYLEQKIFSIVKFKKLGFSAPLNNQLIMRLTHFLRQAFSTHLMYFMTRFTYYIMN